MQNLATIVLHNWVLKVFFAIVLSCVGGYLDPAVGGGGRGRDVGNHFGVMVRHHVQCVHAHAHLGSGFRVQGSGFRVQGPGSRVQGPGYKVEN